eukprot:gene851-1060_t
MSENQLQQSLNKRRLYIERNLQRNSKTILIKSGDVTKEKGVDVLINPTNRLLNLVDLDISAAAGPGFKQECKEYLVQNNTVPIGTSFMVGPNSLKGSVNTGIINMVGPTFNKEKNKECLDYWKEAFFSSLNIAGGHGCRTVAFPTGVSYSLFGYPAERKYDLDQFFVGLAEKYLLSKPSSSIVRILFIGKDNQQLVDLCRLVHRKNELDTKFFTFLGMGIIVVFFCSLFLSVVNPLFFFGVLVSAIFGFVGFIRLAISLRKEDYIKYDHPDDQHQHEHQNQ